MEFSNLKKIFSAKYYAIPDYQRDYEWGAAQNSTLFDDVISLIDSDDNATHFIGAIVTIPFEPDSATSMSIDLCDFGIKAMEVSHIVDGQQRLTSITVLIQALFDAIKTDDELTEKEKGKQQKKLQAILFGNDYNENDESAPKMILNQNTGRYFNSCILKNMNQPYKKVYRGVKRIQAAYDLFVKEINRTKVDLISHGICSSANDFYKKMTDVLLSKIVLVEIECNQSSNAFQVFDSLNGKGLDLTAADRIKNILLSWSPKGKGARKWDALVDSIGEDRLTNFFVALFFSTKGKRISKNKLPNEFKKNYKEEAVQSFDNFFNDISEKARLYGMLRDAKTETNEINEMISDLNQLKSDQSFVILFATAMHYGYDALKSDEYYRFVKALSTLVVRMQICDRSTNRLDSIFSDCINKMNNSDASLDVITNTIKDYTNKLIPDDDFERSFSRFSTADNKIAEYYLRKIENYERTEDNNRDSVKKGLTVEHVIPQTLDDLTKWYGTEKIPEEIDADFKNLVIERLGNKVLLYGDDNSAASNNDYLSKKTVYSEGKKNQTQGTPAKTFKLIEELLEDYPNKFTHEEVDSRSEKMAKIALKIWNTR